MKLVQDYPPNIKDIRKVFDLSGKQVVFTYGDTIYSPFTSKITDDLLIHERVYVKQ